MNEELKPILEPGWKLTTPVEQVPEGLEICCYSTPLQYCAYDTKCEKDWEGRKVGGVNVSVVQCPDCGRHKTVIGGITDCYAYWNESFNSKIHSTRNDYPRRQVHLITGGYVYWELNRCWFDPRFDYPEQYPPECYRTRFGTDYTQERVRKMQAERIRLRGLFELYAATGDADRMKQFMAARVDDPDGFHLYHWEEDTPIFENIPEEFYYDHDQAEH